MSQVHQAQHVQFGHGNLGDGLCTTATYRRSKGSNFLKVCNEACEYSSDTPASSWFSNSPSGLPDPVSIFSKKKAREMRTASNLQHVASFLQGHLYERISCHATKLPTACLCQSCCCLERWEAVVERFPNLSNLLKILIANLIRGFSEPIQLDAYFQGSWCNAETTVFEPSLHESMVGVSDRTYGQRVPKCPSKTCCALYPATSAKSSARHNCSLAD